MDALPLWLPFLFLAIAFLYATVGFGGGSSYLAALALLGLPIVVIPQIALVCNLAVSAGGVWHFHRAGHLDWRKVMPFVVLSVPMAYLGGRVPVGSRVFMILLGGALFAAAWRMFAQSAHYDVARPVSSRIMWVVGVPVGGALGFLAGLVGIGGGIFLAPVILLAGWANAKQAAAAAAVFIAVNSAAGMAGQLSKGLFIGWGIVPLLIAVVVGGQLGSRAGAYRLRISGVRQLLATLIMIVSVRLLWGAF